MDEIMGISMMVLLAALSLPVISTILSGYPKLVKPAKHLIFACYVFIILYLTIFSRSERTDQFTRFNFLWSYRDSIEYSGTLHGLLTGNPGKLTITNYDLLKQVILNILFYIPLGYLLPFAWSGLVERRCGEKTRFRYFPVVFIGFLFSTATELAQLRLNVGLFEYDDIFNNTIGCFIGLILYRLIYKRLYKWLNNE